jgi:hypothetical protein
MAKFKALTPEQAWPDDWKYLLGDGRIAIGLDPATTTKKLSNPTDDPAITRAMLDRAIDLPDNKRVRRIVVGATSERFFATDLRSKFAGKAPVELVIESEGVQYLGEQMSYKLYLGNLVVNMFNDARIFVPNQVWLRNDLRQKEGATFQADPDENGNHADAFDAIAFSLHGLISAGGPVEATAVPVSTIGLPPILRPGLRNPFAHLYPKKYAITRR